MDVVKEEVVDDGTMIMVGIPSDDELELEVV